jgi:integrase
VPSSCQRLHVQAINAKFKKPRTVVLLPQVANAVAKQLAGRSKGWLFPSYHEGYISSRQIQNIFDGIATRAGLQEVKYKDEAGKDRHRIHPIYFRWSLEGPRDSPSLLYMAEDEISPFDSTLNS